MKIIIETQDLDQFCEGRIRSGYYEYTDEELLAAEWMEMFCLNENYSPLPNDMPKFLSYMYDFEINCEVCRMRVKKQKNSFKFKKSFPFKKYHATRTQGSYEIFIDKIFKSLLEKSNLCGYEFIPVYDSSGKMIFDDVFQLKVSNHLSFEMCLNDQYKKIQCQSCGKSYINRPPINTPCRFTYKQNDFSGNIPDIVLTKELIGATSIGADYSLIISNRMYRFLKENNLERDFNFNVIKLI